MRSEQLGDDAFAASTASAPVERDDIAAQVELAVEVASSGAQHGVVGARQLGGNDVVELQLRAHQARASFTLAETRFPSRGRQLRHQDAMTFPISDGEGGARFRDRLGDQCIELLVASSAGR